MCLDRLLFLRSRVQAMRRLRLMVLVTILLMVYVGSGLLAQTGLQHDTDIALLHYQVDTLRARLDVWDARWDKLTWGILGTLGLMLWNVAINYQRLKKER